MWANEGGGANRRGGRDTTMSAAAGKGAAAMKDRTISMLNDLVEEKELSKEDSKRVAALAQLVVYLMFLAFLMVCVFLPGYSRMMYRSTFSIENQFYGSDLCASPRTAPRAAPSRVQRERESERGNNSCGGGGGVARKRSTHTRVGGGENAGNSILAKQQQFSRRADCGPCVEGRDGDSFHPCAWETS